jgi:triphosphoribosyl-dephospho-CoA synthase
VSEQLQQQLFQACLLEATAGKLGNVHPNASFEHIQYSDFVQSAEVATPILAMSSQLGVGQAILNAVRKTQTVCNYNTNLGIAMLLAPFAAVDERHPISVGIDEVLFNLSNFDALLVYDAIRTANPRGLGLAASEDVAVDPTGTLNEVMALAEDRDAIAWEYNNGFSTIFEFGVPLLAKCSDFENTWENDIIQLQLELMARRPDTDVARKCGQADADESARLAQEVLDAGGTLTEAGSEKIREFDGWLRARGSLRNPGTTADLVTACLFVAIREEMITAPEIKAIEAHAQAATVG